MNITDEEKSALMDARNELSDWINAQAMYLAYEGFETALERIGKVLAEFDEVIDRWRR